MQQELEHEAPATAPAAPATAPTAERERLRALADVYETEAGWHIVVALPGVRQEDLQVELEGDTLRVSGRRAAFEPEGFRRLQGYLQGGVLERTFFVPEEVSAEHVEAQLEHGLLRLTIARPVPKRRSIPVRVA
jgi:HSP20 family protein